MILHGDCLEKMKDLADNSVDSVVTDPPYGLKFMGKKWDYSVPSIDIWREVLRVLKPGGHLLSFGGTRTYHRMVVAIEDAGFEIRDQIQWLYGSGFPKSHNIGNGIGTALKPANEPIVLARKPLEGTVAANVSKWGVGGLNIDESRIEGQAEVPFGKQTGDDISANGNGKTMSKMERIEFTPHNQGRWPANVLFDETAAAMLGEPSGFFYVAKASKSERNAGLEGMEEKYNDFQRESSGLSQGKNPITGERSGKRLAPNANHHPTVKPIKLMQYLIKLITPPNGIVLDPFMGSGSTGVAAKALGFEFIGIEMNEEYVEIAKRRIHDSQRSA